jgi:hypothetical protein
MTKAGDAKLLRNAKASGAAHASEQLESDLFSDYVAEMIFTAEKDPDNHNLVRSKSDAMHAAKNVLVDLGHDIARGLDNRDILRIAKVSETRDVSEQDLVDAFNDGLYEVLRRKTTQSWLADEILFQSRQASGKE